MTDELIGVGPSSPRIHLAGTIALGVIVAALLAAAAVTPRPPRAEAKLAAGDAVLDEPAKAVRVVPIYRKIEARAPIEPEPVAVPTEIALKSDAAAPTPPAQEEEHASNREPAPEVRHRHQHAAEDICARHHLHKVITNNGRGWRCRR